MDARQCGTLRFASSGRSATRSPGGLNLLISRPGILALHTYRVYNIREVTLAPATTQQSPHHAHGARQAQDNRCIIQRSMEVSA
eukprot:5175408-Pleurochrysis_carterae.AAC.2